MEWQKDPDNRRRFFRLRYPETRRPTIEVNDGRCKIVEISERGLRLEASSWPFPVGEGVSARIHFSDGTKCILEDAEIYRIDGSEVVIVFSDGVSMQRMAREQRKIIRASLLEGKFSDIDLLRLKPEQGGVEAQAAAAAAAASRGPEGEAQAG